jgi:hypothetical protein
MSNRVNRLCDFADPSKIMQNLSNIRPARAIRKKSSCIHLCKEIALLQVPTRYALRSHSAPAKHHGESKA